MYDLSSRQSYQSLLVAFALIIFLPEPFLSSSNSLSAALDHGVNDSVHCKWNEAYLSFFLNSPWTISLSLSHIMAVDNPSCWKHNDSTSYALLFSLIGSEQHHLKSVANTCAHSMPLLYTVFVNNVSLYMLCASLKNNQHCANSICGTMEHFKDFLRWYTALLC